MIQAGFGATGSWRFNWIAACSALSFIRSILVSSVLCLHIPRSSFGISPLRPCGRHHVVSPCPVCDGRFPAGARPFPLLALRRLRRQGSGTYR